MGQSSSTPRDPPDINPPDSFSIERNLGTRDEDMNIRQELGRSGVAGSSSRAEMTPGLGQDGSSDLPNEPPQTWQQPTRIFGGFSRQMRSIEEEDGTDPEPGQREYRSEAFARMAARRQSTMSRLGSRLLPNSVIRGLLSSEEETPAEGLAHRHGVSRPIPRSDHSSDRFSPFSSLASRGITRRRSVRGPYSIPRTDSADSSVNPSYVNSTTERLPEPTRASWRRSARLHRMRHSLSTPISHMFGQPRSGISSHSEDSSHLPPAPSVGESLPREMDTRLDLGEPPHELDSVEPAVQNGAPVPPGSTGHANAGLMGLRRLPGLLRARPSRALRREEQTPLSRVLQLAAAAIAAQLSGTAGPALPNIQALGNDGLDGSLENFIQSLQHATSAQAQPTGTGEGPSNAGNEGASPPVNFLRVFRFANSDTPTGPGVSSPNASGSESAHPEGMDVDDLAEGGEGRTVTLVVVGVRSVPAGGGGNGEQQAPPVPGGAGLDALLGLPFLSPNAFPRPQDAAGDITQRADGRSRAHAPHHPGSTGLQSPSSVPDHLRQPGHNNSRRLSDTGLRTAYPSFPTSALSESPPGPNPPPSTPAEQGLSAVSSGTSTPSRRPSSASAMAPEALPRLHEDPSMQPMVEPADELASAARQRRRSDSEFARHRALGSGAARRHGVVEPDQPAPPGRSWLIYVVGTNLSENHPALTTPSLFTDV